MGFCANGAGAGTTGRQPFAGDVDGKPWDVGKGAVGLGGDGAGGVATFCTVRVGLGLEDDFCFKVEAVAVEDDFERDDEDLDEEEEWRRLA